CHSLGFNLSYCFSFFFSSRRRHTRSTRDWSSDVCSSDLCCTHPQNRFCLYRYLRTRTDRTAGWPQGNHALALCPGSVKEFPKAASKCQCSVLKGWSFLHVCGH